MTEQECYSCSFPALLWAISFGIVVVVIWDRSDVSSIQEKNAEERNWFLEFSGIIFFSLFREEAYYT